MSETTRIDISYPQVTDRQMCELKTFNRQLNALLGVASGIFTDYAKPTIHEVGYTLKQAALLAHDIEWMCSDLYAQYEAAVRECNDPHINLSAVSLAVAEPSKTAYSVENTEIG